MELSWSTIEIGRDSDGNTVSGLEELYHLQGRYVYVIETPRSLAIRYDSGISNVCYIGRQGDRSRGNRLLSHGKGWISKFLILSQADQPFRVHYCHPRRRNMDSAYMDIEAFLIHEFVEAYGRTPLFNKRKERELGSYEVALNATFLRRRNSNTRIAIDARKAVDDEVVLEDG